MKLSSGISKELKKQFVLDEDALIRIQGVLDKAAKSLQSDVQVVFRVEREDDRFYETANLEDVLSDPNIFGKKVTLIGIEIRENKAEIGTHKIGLRESSLLQSEDGEAGLRIQTKYTSIYLQKIKTGLFC